MLGPSLQNASSTITNKVTTLQNQPIRFSKNTSKILSEVIQTLESTKLIFNIYHFPGNFSAFALFKSLLISQLKSFINL